MSTKIWWPVELQPNERTVPEWSDKSAIEQTDKHSKPIANGSPTGLIPTKSIKVSSKSHNKFHQAEKEMSTIERRINIGSVPLDTIQRENRRVHNWSALTVGTKLRFK